MLQALLLLAVLIFVPEMAERYSPNAARYVPPFFITWLLAISYLNGLAVLRTRATLQWLFPGCAIELPLWGDKGKRLGVAY